MHIRQNVANFKLYIFKEWLKFGIDQQFCCYKAIFINRILYSYLPCLTFIQSSFIQKLMRIGHKPNLITNYKFKIFSRKKGLEFYNYLTSPVLNSYLLDIDQVKIGFDTFLSRFFNDSCVTGVKLNL